MIGKQNLWGRIMIWSIMGTIAAICTTVGFVPQIIKGIKTKELKDVSPVMLGLLLVGVSLWLAYGIHLRNLIIALANGFTLLFILTIIYLRVLFEKKKNKNLITDIECNFIS